MRTKLSCILLCLGALGMLAGCAGTSSTDAAKQALGTLSADIAQVLADARPVLVALAQVPEARGDDADACTRVMAEKIKTYPQFTTFGAAHLDGNLFCTAQAQTAAVSIDDRAYFHRALESKDLGVGDYQIGKVTGKQSAGLGFPVLDAAGKAHGIVLAPVDLDWLNQRVANLKLPAGANALVVDSQGVILATNIDPKMYVGKPLSESVLGDTMMRQIEGTGEFAGPDGVMRVYAFTAPAGSNKNWFVAVGLPK